MEHFGQTLCEECYMQALSPARACDPWAVRSAQSLSQLDQAYAELSKTQTEILQVLEETGGAEREVIAERLEMPLSELDREIATLRHMEKVRGELREGKKIVRLW
jgi:predicted transcriptional regulator